MSGSARNPYRAHLSPLPGEWQIVTDTGGIALRADELREICEQSFTSAAWAFPLVPEARAWAEARQAAVEVFASATAESAARTSAWNRLSDAERALLDAVKALTPEPQEPFDPKAHPLVGKRFRLRERRGIIRETEEPQCWISDTASAGSIGKVIEVWADCVRLQMEYPGIDPPYRTEWATAAPPYRMHEIVARFLEDVEPLEDHSDAVKALPK